MSDSTQQASRLRLARILSGVNLAVWGLFAGGIVVMMCKGGGPGGIGGVMFLAIIFAFLGGLGVMGGALGLRRVSLASRALAQGDDERASRETSAALKVNVMLGGAQVALSLVSFLMLTKLHH